MSWTSDPTRALRRRVALTWLVGLGAVAALAAWAWRAPEPPEGPDATLRPASKQTADGEEADGFDPTAFEVALWHVPPAPEPVVERSPDRPQLPPRLTLVAIIREPGEDGDVLRAALHDPDQDELLTVAAGDRAGAYEVTRVTAEGVELSDGARATWLALRPDEPRGGGR